ncbi:MAG: hypothetical protein RBS17_11110, partial [Coriobacteriia bacterium]|nr:hypothetical protein [Coriobacteriia bacterium]
MRGSRQLTAVALIVAVSCVPSIAYATEWMPGMGTVPGSGTYLDYQPWRFTEQIEAYNDYAMWEQQLKLPASQRVANSFVEFQGKVRAGYRGISVNQAASIYGTSAEKVVAWAQRTKDYLKRAPGSRAVAKTPKGGILAGAVMGVLIDVAATEAIDALIGERTILHADGSVCTAPYAAMCPDAWTGPHYYHYAGGLLTDERIPPELASLFPGFETYLDVGGVPVYSFTAKEGVVRPRQPGDADAYGAIPAFVILNSAYYSAEWTEDAGWLMSRVLAAG